MKPKILKKLKRLDEYFFRYMAESQIFWTNSKKTEHQMDDLFDKENRIFKLINEIEAMVKNGN